MKRIGQQGLGKGSSHCLSEAEETATQQFQIPPFNSDVSGNHVPLANLLRMPHAHSRIIADTGKGLTRDALRDRLGSEHPRQDITWAALPPS
ncbi:hypothetical protein [Streptomyces sp. NPDC096132]|uniref:hypothetical protein n=1 Tax=Streptomyces sp. NPDC096132 TaxID=3366075 RepID=UPI00382836D3